MREIERSGATVEEAVGSALAELGLSEQEADVVVVQEPKQGILGINAKPAVVRVRERGRGVEEPEDLDEQADVAADFVEGLLEAMGVDADVEIGDDNGIVYVDVVALEGEDAGLLIGRHGAMIDAIQELTRGWVLRQTGERCRVLVDIEDYRKRRRSQVVGRAVQHARRVSQSGRPERLEPMSAYERKIVHDTVAERFGDLETSSEGDEPDRRVVIRRRGVD